jgi:hypothetical protein
MKKSYTIFMPTGGKHGKVDVNIKNNLYVNASVIQRLSPE